MSTSLLYLLFVSCFYFHAVFFILFLLFPFLVFYSFDYYSACTHAHKSIHSPKRTLKMMMQSYFLTQADPFFQIRSYIHKPSLFPALVVLRFFFFFLYSEFTAFSSCSFGTVTIKDMYHKCMWRELTTAVFIKSLHFSRVHELSKKGWSFLKSAYPSLSAVRINVFNAFNCPE